MTSSGGGFILSPPISVASSSFAHNTLPLPRSTPLKAGGPKESAFIRHVDAQMLQIQRRFAKRTAFSTSSNPEANQESEMRAVANANVWPTTPGDVKGYTSMKQACKDIEKVVDIVWVSGTPSLQVPYLISIALLLSEIIGGMPPSPRSLFRVLSKLDVAFAGLLQGRDVESGEMLAGFERGKGVSGTEKVRMRSLVERTRRAIMESFHSADFEYEDEGEADVDGMDTDTDGGLVLENEDHANADGYDEGDDSWDMQLARVYDRTVVELGGSLEEPSLGILTEGR